jgi:hypothetical protein
MFVRKILFLSLSIVLSLGCGGTSTPTPKSTASVAVAEAPLGALKNLAKALDSPNAADRKKAADEIAKLGAPARPLQQSLKKAIEREPDAGVKAAHTTALEKTNG